MNWLDRVRAGLREHEDERGEVAAGETSASPEADLPAKPPAPVLRQPEAIGSFQVLRVLGQGAMGVVYAARSERLDREVAVKVLKLDRVDSPELVERFEIEARAAARLRHPNIVGIHEVGSHQDGADGAERRYLVMELVQGRSLAARLRDEGALPGREAASIAERLARALAYAHERWVLHRDIKPANVLLSDESGEPMLTDFGMAKVLDGPGGAPSPTVSGQVMGTPAYMPPEQARGDHGRVDRRSDVYSLGATLYEMLTGRPPWSAPSVMAVLARVTSLEPVLAPSRVRPDVDPELETICLKCLEKEPAERYLTADDLALDLSRWLADEPIAARRPTLVARGRKWLRRNRALARALGAVLVVAALVLVAATVAFVRRLDDERARADAAADEASRQAERARARAGVAQDALRVLIYEVRDQLAHVPGARVRQVRGELLEHALGALERLRDAELAEGSRLEAAEAQRQIGDLCLARADVGLAPAAAAFERAVELCRQARADAPGDDDARRDLAASLLALAAVRLSQGERARADALAAEAHELAMAAPRRLLLAAAAQERRALVARDGEENQRALELLSAAASLARDAPPGPDRDACLLGVLEEQANLLSNLGDLPAARAVLDEVIPLARSQAGAGDASPRLLFVLCDVLARQGELPRALAAIDEAVTAVRARLAADPSQAVLRAEMGQFLVRRAHVGHQAGRAEAAAADLEEAIALLRPLAAEQPDDLALAESLDWALSTLASVQLDLGAPTRAATAAAEAVERYRARLARAPDDLALSLELAQVLSRLSRARREEGDVAAALELAREVVARRRVATRTGVRRDRQSLLASLQELGDLLIMQGRTDEARDAMAEALALARQLRAEDPTNLEHHENLVGALQSAAKVGAAPPAEAFEEALAEARALVARDPARAGARRWLGAVANQLASLRLAQGDLDAARAAAELGAETFRALVADAGEPGHRRDLAVSLCLLGEARELAGEVDAALARYGESVTLLRDVVAGHPSFRRDLAVSIERAATLRLTSGDVAGAADAWAECLQLCRALLEADASSVLARRDLSGALVGLAQARGLQGELEAAVTLWREAVANHRALVAVAPQVASELEQLSGGLARAEQDLRLREVLRGASEPAAPDEHLALGYALYERGEHAAAAEQFARALDDEALRSDLRGGHLYNGACAAALAMAAASDPGARAALRERALGWLREDARRRGEVVARAPEAERARAARALAAFVEHARGDPDLAALRGPDLDALYPP